MCERATPRAEQTGFTGLPCSTRASAQSTFFASELDSLLQNFGFHRLLAEHALQLGDLGTCCSQFGGRDHRLASGHCGEPAFTLQLALVKQLARCDPMLTCDQRHTPPRL